MDKAILLMGNFMQPATRDMVENWIAGLSTLVAKRVGDDEEVRLEMYVSQLMRYPADIVQSVLFDETYKFWPTWFELKPKLDLKNRKRNMILDALRNPTEPERETATDEQRKNGDKIISDAGYGKKVT